MMALRLWRGRRRQNEFVEIVRHDFVAVLVAGTGDPRVDVHPAVARVISLGVFGLGGDRGVGDGGADDGRDVLYRADVVHLLLGAVLEQFRGGRARGGARVGGRRRLGEGFRVSF